MKKSSLAIAVVAALAVAYPGAAWLTGKRLETKLNKADKNDPVLSKFKIVKQSYKRGVFSSTQEQTFELRVENLFASTLPNASSASAFQDNEGEATAEATVDEQTMPHAMSEPIQISVINHITHGPFPGMFGVAAGKVETELVLDPKVLAEIKKVFGDKKFLQITTLLNYGGGGTMKLSSPDATFNDPNGSTKVEWKGVKAEIGFDEDYKKFQFNFLTPGFKVTDQKESGNFSIGEMKADGNIDRAFGNSMLYLGKTTASIASIEFSSAAIGGFKAGNITLESDSTAKKDLIDMGIKMGMASLKFGEAEFSNFHYDYSLHNIHGDTLSKMSNEFSAVAKTGATPNEQMQQMQTIWKKYGMELLKYNPSISLDRLSVSGKSGEFKTNASAKLVGVTEADFNMPQSILQKLEAEGDLSFAEALIEEVVNMTQKDPNARAMALTMANATITGFQAQGYLTRKEKALTSHMEWKQGKASINGKPYPPVMSAAPMPADAMPQE
ncbi:YdgA family protein [Undibacterium cyanobacteriorum]|uniref:YdgA family protein n=1 Tax=Undibacterium cyanobacteriorum TaxID=3073561 RepID=A0ABY9RIP7_9BURK|nr:YdgA family protein [Undibacterium sp. 20NA77.5]WMW80713.1 YdgA family protein [Undibacterium sp. 20NA77.5]